MKRLCRNLIFTVSALLALQIGCKPGPLYPHATVSGTVTLDGKPLESGCVSVMTPQANVGCFLDAAGKFKLKNVPKGTICFVVQSMEETGQTVKDPFGNETPVKTSRIPKQYEKGIEREITGDIKDMKIEFVTN